MEQNILLLTDENLPCLSKFNLSMYSQILVTIVSPEGTVAIPTAKQLLAIQSQQQCPIRLELHSSSVVKQGVFWAWKLGELAVSAPDAQITILTEDNTLQLLAELCAEQDQSVQILQIHATAGEIPSGKTETLAGTAETQPTDHQTTATDEEEKKASAAATAQAEKEERQRRNEQIINSLMKKASVTPYQVAEGKPVSAVKEQEIAMALQGQPG